jgi:hypothetical protein
MKDDLYVIIVGSRYYVGQKEEKGASTHLLNTVELTPVFREGHLENDPIFIGTVVPPKSNDYIKAKLDPRSVLHKGYLAVMGILNAPVVEPSDGVFDEI